MIMFVDVTRERELYARLGQQKQHAGQTCGVNLSSEKIIFDKNGKNRLDESKTGDEKNIGKKQELGNAVHAGDSITENKIRPFARSDLESTDRLGLSAFDVHGARTLVRGFRVEFNHVLQAQLVE